MATKIRLTHVSNLPGATGVPGDELTVDDAIARRFEAADGCVILPADEKPAKPAKADDKPEKPAKPAKADDK